MPINFLLLFHAVLAGLCAWIYAGVLNKPGMLLYKPYRAIYLRLEARYSNVEENAPMWWKPVWGCVTCVSTWWGLVTYLVHIHYAHLPFRLDMFLYSGAVALLTGVLLNRHNA